MRKSHRNESGKLPLTPFQGEMMICVMCDRHQFSDPNIESGWTAISVDGELLEYYCPVCFDKLIASAQHE